MTKARVSGLGVVPERSSVEAAHVIAGECPEAPYIPLLPSRGPGADSIGRTGAIISQIGSEFSIQTVPTGWRLTSISGRDISRAQGFLSADLDAMEEQFHDSSAPLTASITGPITWAASVEDSRGEKLIRDHGALREVSSALSHAIPEMVQQLNRRFPTMDVFIQIDEPLAMSASIGAISTASTLHTYVALDPQHIFTLWDPIFNAIGLADSRFGVNFIGSSMPLSDQFLSSLMLAGCQRFFHISESKLLGEIIESGAETVWLCNPAWSGSRVAQDLVARISALGFDVDVCAQNVLLVPPETEMLVDWGRARNAWTKASTAVDLLNDPDRLASL